MKRMHVGPILAAVVAVAVVVIACSAPVGPSGGTDPKPPAATAVQPAPTGPFTSFSDGQYEVGSQPGMVKPGKYRTTVPAKSINCYWERRSDLAGGLEGIIANANHKPGSPVVLTIAATDRGFNTSGCGEWKLAP